MNQMFGNEVTCKNRGFNGKSDPLLQKTIVADDDTKIVSDSKTMVLITQRIPWNSTSLSCHYVQLMLKRGSNHFFKCGFFTLYTQPKRHGAKAAVRQLIAYIYAGGRAKLTGA